MDGEELATTKKASARDPARPEARVQRPPDRARGTPQILVGVATVVSGWAVVEWPGRSLYVLSMIVGATLLATAIIQLWLSVTTRDGEARARVLGVIVGLFLLVAGVLCLRQSVLTITVLALLLGLSWLVSGVVMIHRAVTEADDCLTTGIAGVVISLAGIVVIAFPDAGAVAAVWLAGVGLVAVGVVVIARGGRRSQ